MREIGFKIKHVERENFITQMEIIIKENGNKIKLMDRGFIYIPMVQNIKEIGKMIFNKVLAYKVGKMGLNIKDIIKKEKNMEKENIYGQMVLHTMGNGYKTEFKDSYIN